MFFFLSPNTHTSPNQQQQQQKRRDKCTHIAIEDCGVREKKEPNRNRYSGVFHFFCDSFTRSILKHPFDDYHSIFFYTFPASHRTSFSLILSEFTFHFIVHLLAATFFFASTFRFVFGHIFHLSQLTKLNMIHFFLCISMFYFNP